MDPNWDDLVGVLVVKDQEHLVRLVLETSRHVMDRYHVVDNCSTDDTVAEIERATDDFDLDLYLETREGYAGRLFLDAMQEYPGDYAFRLEGDQAYFDRHLEAAVKTAGPGINVSCQVYMLRNYCHLMNKEFNVNAPHKTIYPVDGTNRMVDGKLWPRSAEHRTLNPSTRFHDDETAMEGARPIGVNVKVLSPAERVKRWHRPAWWHWGEWTDGLGGINQVGGVTPDKFRLRDYEMPYREHMGLEDYVWLLRNRGLGSAAAPWGQGDVASLDALGRAYIDWDVRQNCSFYPFDYPTPLSDLILDRGYGLGVV